MYRTYYGRTGRLRQWVSKCSLSGNVQRNLAADGDRGKDAHKMVNNDGRVLHPWARPPKALGCEAAFISCLW